MDEEIDLKKQKLREQKRKYKKSRKRVEILYTKDEYDFLKLQAKRLSSPVAGYIKNVSLQRLSILVKEPKTDLEAVAQIRKIGVNINQIAKLVNEEKNVTGSLQSYGNMLNESIENLHRYITKILEK